jgi:hypothetical protein
MRFEDGPLSIVNCVPVPSNETWFWPLPDRLSVLAHLEHVERIAAWPTEGDGEGLPVEILESPNVVRYEKVTESQLSRGSDLVARGAVYRLDNEAVSQ